MVLTRYKTASPRIPRNFRIASVADLHNGKFARVLELLEEAAPDAVAVPGDVVDDPDNRTRGIDFLTACARRYPTFVSVGNHETKSDFPSLLPLLAKTGAELLDDRLTLFSGIAIAGLSSGWRHGVRQKRTKETPPPTAALIAELNARPEYRILLCHHPEYYPRYLAKTEIELILAGHAHGGQWNFFGQGIFAPGQGILPRYSAGFYDGRMALSRGLCATHRYIPRLFNPREIVVVEVEKQ